MPQSSYAPKIRRVGLHRMSIRTARMPGPKFACRVCGFLTATEHNRKVHERVYHRIMARPAQK